MAERLYQGGKNKAEWPQKSHINTPSTFFWSRQVTRPAQRHGLEKQTSALDERDGKITADKCEQRSVQLTRGHLWNYLPHSSLGIFLNTLSCISKARGYYL